MFSIIFLFINRWLDEETLQCEWIRGRNGGPFIEKKIKIKNNAPWIPNEIRTQQQQQQQQQQKEKKQKKI